MPGEQQVHIKDYVIFAKVLSILANFRIASIPEELTHFHLESLPPEWYIFENHHSFLVVGNLVFFLSNLDHTCTYFSEEGPTDFEADGFSFRVWEGLGNSEGE